MGEIQVLDKHTIDQIAAGEVIERPKSVVKELVENAIDAGASAITVEITDGGVRFIRVTDNGRGIAAEDIRTAFLRHATSKIRDITDLLRVTSLGFRGEALSSIAAVSQIDVISKCADSLTGIRYCLDGGEETLFEEVGAPDGTTFIVRNLFYNVPARKKFLRQDKTEGSYVADLMEQLALSHPDVAFHFISNRKERFHTSGNRDLKELIHRIYGRETAAALVPLYIEAEDGIRIDGFLGEPSINRANRGFELFFVNGRFIKNDVLQKALEDGYREYLMQHKFPFAILHLTIDPDEIDVNVHPAKLDIRFKDPQRIYALLLNAVEHTLSGKEMIPKGADPDKVVPLHTDNVAGVLLEKRQETAPEPFETRRFTEQMAPLGYTGRIIGTESTQEQVKGNVIKSHDVPKVSAPRQLTFFAKEEAEAPEATHVLSEENRPKFRIIGQLFQTYWLFELEDSLYLIDQHAAHEKVNYERFLKRYRERTLMTQRIEPPQIMTFSAAEEEMYEAYASYFEGLGFVVEPFGAREYAIREIPLDLFGSRNAKEMFLDILDELTSERNLNDPKVITNKIASMACKASVKGETLMHEEEIEELLDELLTLDNPYNCPHGRPTIITMTRYELDKRFKRVVD